MVPEQIEREIVIAAPVEQVWPLVTEPEHVGRWFGDAGAEIDLRPGGAMAVTWKEHGTVRCRVEKVDPPHLFSYRWARPIGAEPRAGNSTLVEFSLRPEGESTRLRVVESGFRDLDLTAGEQTSFAEENTEGWTLELAEFQTYAERSTR